MKRPLLSVLALASLALTVRAQVTIELQLDQKQFLPGEKMVARARISNFSGQVLEFGATRDWLTFEVQALDGGSLEQRREPDVLGEFKLETSSIATRKVDLAPAFNFARPGRYRIIATVNVPQWDRRWSSKELMVDVIKGTKIWERDFGVPSAAGGTPEMRKFALLEARYLDHNTLYARLTDAAETDVLSVLPVGPLLNFSRPDGQMDRDSRLHLLWQDGARTFCYVTMASGGEITLRQTYQITDSRPMLRPAADGAVQVVGGARVVSPRDLPPASTASATPPPELPASTP